MTRTATVATVLDYDVRKPTTDPRCTRCGAGPLLASEQKSGLCPDCKSKSAPRVHTRCRLCGIILGLDDDCENGFCLDHATRPEAKRLTAAAPIAKPITPAAPQPRPFTPADKSLIQHTGSYLPPEQLLGILNARLVADVGAAAVPYTREQLHAALQELVDTKPSSDWSGLRRILGQARRSRLLDAITPQLVDDFAICFQLAPAQVMRLRDVIRHAKEER